MYHIDNARTLDSLFSLQAQESVTSSSSLDIYEVHPRHALSYQTPTTHCDYIISATMIGLSKKHIGNGRGEGGIRVKEMHNLLHTVHLSQTVKK